jgi:8-oxo-dGTP pyrophosphatase MutT (NUDIX family)
LACNASPTIGVFAGIFDIKGRILLVKIETGQFAGEWDLPGGGVDAEKAKEATGEQFLLEEVAREVKEETGIAPRLQIGANPVLFPTLLKGGEDLALPILVGAVDDKPTKGTTQFTSFSTVQRLANGSPAIAFWAVMEDECIV